jgi:oligopeptide/dipeptide ABC transporter ATP-binding protein
MSLLRVDRLSIRYGAGYAVRDLGFSVERGESVGLVGESGSGKTQTALAILGLLSRAAAVTGSIRLEDEELLAADEKRLDALRARRIAMVFQDPMQALNPYLRVGAQLRHIVHRHRIGDPGQAAGRVCDMLRRVGLPDPERQYRAYPHELSGGMRQRVMIAAALIAEPAVLIADEPTTALDVTVQAQILELLESVRGETALLLITHDLGVIAGRCERMLVIEAGELVEAGTTREVFAAPHSEYTRRLLAAAPRLADEAAPAAGTGDTVLSVVGARVRYSSRGRTRLEAVRGVDLSVGSGEAVAVVGESGSGKSSLVRAVLGLVPLASGRVTFCGTELGGAAQSRAKRLRRDLQLVFQDPVGSLDPQMRVAAIVGEPLTVHEPGLSAAVRRDAVERMLARMGLGTRYLDRYPHQLSGGEAQRVAIARALISGPRVLVCDEAVSALDGTVRAQLLALLAEEQRVHGLSIVFITHDLAVVRGFCQRVLVMYLGALAELADNSALFGAPRHPYTRALLDAVPVPDPAAPGGRATIRSEVASALTPPAGCTFHPRCPHARERCRTEIPAPRRVGDSLVACHRAEEI